MYNPINRGTLLSYILPLFPVKCHRETSIPNVGCRTMRRHEAYYLRTHVRMGRVTHVQGGAGGH